MQTSIRNNNNTSYINNYQFSTGKQQLSHTRTEFCNKNTKNGNGNLGGHVAGGRSRTSSLSKPGSGVKKNVRFHKSVILPEQDVSSSVLNQAHSNGKKRGKTKKQAIPSEEVNNTGIGSNGTAVNWKAESTRWNARIESLLEMESSKVKHLADPSTGVCVRYCEVQKHLLIGKGPDFSTVLVGITDDGAEVAMKKINTKRTPLLSNAEKRARILDLPPHPALLKTQHIIRDKTHFYILKNIGEYSLKEELKRRQFMLKETKLPLETQQICSGIAMGLSHLHVHGMLHMALKPENVMIDSSIMSVCLTEYGIHDRFCSKQKLEGPSRCWLAGELLKNEEKNAKNRPQNSVVYTKESDIASLGMLFYYVMTEGGHPFGDFENAGDACVRNIVYGNYNMKSIVDPFAHHLLKNMIFKEPEKRFTIEQVLAHPYFWSDETRTNYTLSLAKAATWKFDLRELSEDASSDYREIMGYLWSKKLEILDAYVNIKHLNEIPTHCGDLRTLLDLITEQNEEQIKAETADLKHVAVAKMWKCFPGLLLFTHQKISIANLEKILSLPEMPGKKENVFTTLQSFDSGTGLDSPEAIEGNMRSANGSKPNTIPTSYREGILPTENSNSGIFFATSPDDGIDMLSPLSGSVADDNVFFGDGDKSTMPIHCHDGRRPQHSHCNPPVSPGSFNSTGTIDNYFEFDEGYQNQTCSAKFNGDCLENDAELHLLTDIDELD